MHFELPVMMEISVADELRTRLDDLLNDSDTRIVLDGSAVNRVDASTLQLLSCFVQQLRVQGKTLDWQAASEELKASAALLDLTDNLQLA